jgi:hypothetical protein
LQIPFYPSGDDDEGGITINDRTDTENEKHSPELIPEGEVSVSDLQYVVVQAGGGGGGASQRDRFCCMSCTLLP